VAGKPRLPRSCRQSEAMSGAPAGAPAGEVSRRTDNNAVGSAPAPDRRCLPDGG
jgi:hypothetical protein